MSNRLNVAPNDLSAYWMPFTANRQFKQAPRLFARAKDMYYYTVDGRQVLDGTAGLWCCNAGHGRPRIVQAVAEQVAEMDYSPAFQMGHPKIFELANRVVDIAPEGMNHVFFTNSGSESVETALKMAIAYHRTRGEGSRFRLIGRERGYHGVNFGGISVGGMVANRKMFGTLLSGVDHLPHTYDPKQAFTRGIPGHGAERADDLERLVALHDPSTIAAVIVEPVAGSTGVLMPPKGYLEKLRAITRKYGILLIFDEVITGFGRLGTPFATDYFGVTPDLITCAKGLTNGVIPMGAVLATSEIHDTFMNAAPENAIEFMHGYTYSGNPVAAAAGLATLETYREEGLLTRGAELAPYWEEGLHSLKGLPHIIDIRNLGFLGAIELEPMPGKPTVRAFTAYLRAFEQGVLIRTTGDTIAMSPPLIADKSHIDTIIETLRGILKTLE